MTRYLRFLLACGIVLVQPALGAESFQDFVSYLNQFRDFANGSRLVIEPLDDRQASIIIIVKPQRDLPRAFVLYDPNRKFGGVQVSVSRRSSDSEEVWEYIQIDPMVIIGDRKYGIEDRRVKTVFRVNLKKGLAPIFEFEAERYEQSYFGWRHIESARIRSMPVEPKSPATLMAPLLSVEPAKVLEGARFIVEAPERRLSRGILGRFAVGFDHFEVLKVDAHEVVVQPFFNERKLIPIVGRILPFNSGAFMLQLFWRSRWGMQSSLMTTFFMIDEARAKSPILVDLFREWELHPTPFVLNGQIRRNIRCESIVAKL